MSHECTCNLWTTYHLVDSVLDFWRFYPITNSYNSETFQSAYGLKRWKEYFSKRWDSKLMSSSSSEKLKHGPYVYGLVWSGQILRLWIYEDHQALKHEGFSLWDPCIFNWWGSRFSYLDATKSHDEVNGYPLIQIHLDATTHVWLDLGLIFPKRFRQK